VDSANGAAVRIAMTVGGGALTPVIASEARQSMAGRRKRRLLSVSSEQTGEFGEVSVTLAETTGVIHAD